MSLSRRRILSSLVAAPLLPMAPRAWAADAGARCLRFENLHTGEALSVEYAAGGRYLDDALAEVNHVLRDFRTGEAGTIDPALLDLLHALSERIGSRRPFQVISGYRSPVTNAALHRNTSGVAGNSLHMQGQAIDVRLADVALADLREAALALQLGGVGFYPASNFVHVDTGRVRRW